MIPKPTKKPKKSKQGDSAIYKECVADMPSCMLCGSSYWLAIHHARHTPIRLTYKGNLIRLCKTCHELVHSDEKKYKPILVDMINKFYGLDYPVYHKI